MVIRDMTQRDWNDVARIYNEGISTGYATFETNVPQYGDWDKAHIKLCRLIAEEDGSIQGWAALSPVSSRCVYGGVAEISIYIGENARGKGIGKVLLARLIEESEQAGYWTLQSGIFPENKASIKLHERLGFRFLGKRESIGKTNDGIWKDNLLFERRSKKVRID